MRRSKIASFAFAGLLTLGAAACEANDDMDAPLEEGTPEDEETPEEEEMPEEEETPEG